MKKFLELNEEVEKHLISAFDSFLKEYGFSGHAVISKLLAAVRIVPDDQPEKKE